MNNLISRKEAIETINSLTVSVSGVDVFPPEGKKSVIETLDLLPGVPLHNKWISVKDRLPPHQGKKVLVINGHRDVRIYALWKKEYGNKWTWIDENGKFNHVNNITHWMPLPEPPKEES